MDWEGGTIGAIVPALMGHGEAGRASPWPFFFDSACCKHPDLSPETKETAADTAYRRLCLSYPATGCGLREQVLDYPAVSHQGDRSASVGVVFHGWIDTEVVIETRRNVIW